MALERYSLQEVAKELGIDSRLVTEVFRKIEAHTLGTNSETEVEGFGIFHGTGQPERVWQNRFGLSELRARVKMSLRSLRREQTLRMTLRWPGAWVRFRVEDIETQATFVISFDDGLLLEHLKSVWGEWYRDGEPMEQQRVGFASLGPRIFAQYSDAEDKRKANVRLNLRNNRWEFDEPQSGKFLGGIMYIEDGWGWDYISESLVRWIIPEANPGDDEKAIPGTGFYQHMALYSLIRWMATNRSAENNTGPYWDEDTD